MQGCWLAEKHPAMWSRFHLMQHSLCSLCKVHSSRLQLGQKVLHHEPRWFPESRHGSRRSRLSLQLFNLILSNLWRIFFPEGMSTDHRWVIARLVSVRNTQFNCLNALSSVNICTPEMIRGSNPGALIFRLYSEYGWLSDGSMLYSSGGVSRVMPSMIPSLSVCSSSITSSGVPVDATETTAPVTGYAVCSEMILILMFRYCFHLPF